MKLKYTPGIRPTPMLMYYTDENPQLFNQMKESNNLKDEFVSSHKHYWNQSAYIIIDEANKQVISMVFETFIYVIYLLRVVNEEFTISIDENTYEIIKNDLEQLKGELDIIE